MPDITQQLAEIKGYLEQLKDDADEFVDEMQGLLVVSMEDYTNGLINNEDLRDILEDAQLIAENHVAQVELATASKIRDTSTAILNIIGDLMGRLV